MSAQSRLIYGLDAAPPEPIALRAGPLTMLFDNGDLRYIKHGNTEIVRRIYAAARDRDWGTAPNVLSQLRIIAKADAFDVTYTCTNRHADIDFVWQGHLSGRRDGSLLIQFDGVARKSFLRARLGLCVLHPAAAAGDAVRIEQVDGGRRDARFPRRIAPQRVVAGVIKPVAPFEEMRAMTHTCAPGLQLRIGFAGDIFEMEDQRNWTDGSFKTYCTPLRLPVPVHVPKGARVRQRIALALHEDGLKPPAVAVHQPPADVVHVTVLHSTHALPAIGFGAGLSMRAMTAQEQVHLQALKIDHLRVDLALYGRDWRAALARALDHAAALNTKLELAVFVTDDAARELAALAVALPPARMIARANVYHRAEATTDKRWIAAARAAFGACVPLFAGTNKFFTQLNCSRPDRQTLAMLDGLCFGFNPQVHAFDNRSIAEAPETQAETVRSAQSFARGLPLALTPITLRPRFSLGENGPEPRDRRFEFDPREHALFGAAWTVASLKHIAQTGGVASTTWYEHIDNRGIVRGAGVFPNYHVFAAVSEFRGVVQSVRSSAALRVEALALRSADDKRTRLLLANLSGQAEPVVLKGLHGTATVRMLDAAAARRALRDAAAFRAEPGAVLNSMRLTLPPCALAQIDLH
jgi:D-apionolactonase